MSAVVLADEGQVSVQAHANGIMDVIARAARDPNVDIDKMERLLQMQERIQARDAKIAFTEALATMQPLLPIIDRRGRIVIKGKDSKPDQSTAFARWEDISIAITPILSAHGFSLSFRPGVTAEGRVTMTAVLRHRAGFEDEATVILPHDSSGSKNAVQAVGSSNSYGKRYAATAILNIVTIGEDDDGQKAGDADPVSDAQLAALRKALEDGGRDVAKFCQYAKIAALPDLPASRFDWAMQTISAAATKPGR
jgi:hypothetical protein